MQVEAVTAYARPNLIQLIQLCLNKHERSVYAIMYAYKYSKYIACKLPLVYPPPSIPFRIAPLNYEYLHIYRYIEDTHVYLVLIIFLPFLSVKIGPLEE